MYKRILKQMPSNGMSKDQQPETEVTPKAKRRRFSAQYKLRVLEEADRCTQPGEIGALLRRQGLYSSNLTTSPRQREQGQIGALSPKKRGPKPVADAAMARELTKLRKEKQHREQKLKKAELIIEVQKKSLNYLAWTSIQSARRSTGSRDNAFAACGALPGVWVYLEYYRAEQPKPEATMGFTSGRALKGEDRGLGSAQQ